MNIFNNKATGSKRNHKNASNKLFKLIILIVSFGMCFSINTTYTVAVVNLTDNPLLDLAPESPGDSGTTNLTDNPLLNLDPEPPSNSNGSNGSNNSNNSNNTNWVNPTPGSQGSQGSQGQSSQPGGLPSYYDQNWSSQNNQQSPVITPGQQTQAMLDQQETPNSESCGISPSKGKWNYCLLAPLNGLIGEKTGSGKNVVEKFDISDGLSPFFFKVYRLGVMAAIGLSIVMISFGGIQLATTDTIGGTDSGRKKINAAFAGLFIALFSYVLLYTINPALVNNGSGDIFKKTEIKP